MRFYHGDRLRIKGVSNVLLLMHERSPSAAVDAPDKNTIVARQNPRMRVTIALI